MVNKKRALLVVLAITMVISLLTGCTVTSNTSSATTTTPSTAVGDSSQQASGSTVSVTPGEITVAYSDAGLVNVWRIICQQDMERAAKEAGVKLISADGQMDPAKQLSDVQSLLAQKPNVIIVAPAESKALAPIVEMCNKANVPLIIIDRTIDAEPGVGMYKAEIVQSHELSGILLASKTVELLIAKNGEAKGNVVKLQGAAGASAVIDAQKGWDEVMASYPNIKVVGVQDTGFTKEGGMTAMENFLQTFPKGQIDIVWSDYSDMTQGGIQAIKDAGRDELLGYIVGEGGHIKCIEDVLNGNIALETQTPPYFGDVAIKNALDIIAGKTVLAKQDIAIKIFDTNNKVFAQNYYDQIKAAGLEF